MLTIYWLEIRRNQYVQVKIQEMHCNCNLHKYINASGSALAEHLLNNYQSILSVTKDRFSVEL